MRGAFVWLIAASACGEPSVDAGALDSALERETALSSSPRRPVERYVMTREGARCSVEIVRGDAGVERLAVDYACPKDLEIGERIRLSGFACMREGAAPERNVPVVCPGPLLKAERDRRKEATVKDGGT